MLNKRLTNDHAANCLQVVSSQVLGYQLIYSTQSPNGLRLSGDGGAADGVRCSRRLGGLVMR